MSRQVLGHAFATLAICAGVVEPAAYAEQIDQDDATDGAGADESSTGSADGQYDVTGLVDSASFGGARPQRRALSTAFAPSLIASEDTCMGSRSFGVQAIGFGISFATTWQDRQCRRVKNARQLYALGYPEAAVQLLCMDEEVRAAMERAGTPCEGVRFIRLDLPEEPEPEPEPPPLISFNDVLFDFDRATIRPDALPTLEPLLAMLQADPTMSIDIEGHTDWIGSDAYNEGLSLRRAQAVVGWLVSRGVSRDRISAVGRGESEPVATNQTVVGRQLNRRVEVRRRDSALPLASGG